MEVSKGSHTLLNFFVFNALSVLSDSKLYFLHLMQQWMASRYTHHLIMMSMVYLWFSWQFISDLISNLEHDSSKIGVDS